MRVLHTFMISTVCSSHSSYFGLLRHEDNGDALRELRGVIMRTSVSINAVVWEGFVAAQK